MTKEEFTLIAQKVFNNQASEEEYRVYLAHINAFVKENPAWENLSSESRHQAKEETRNIIFQRLATTVPVVKKDSRYQHIWYQYASAAAIVVIFACTVYYHYKPKVTTNVYSLNEIRPGRTGATLTLNNGDKISLSSLKNRNLLNNGGIGQPKVINDGLFYKASSDGLSANADNMNTLATSNGQTYTATLSDGSKIWLNSASSITYAVNLLRNGERRVKLVGEAYFEVSKDAAHPFIVETSRQNVEVLGTHFNVNSYADDKLTTTTLMEGSVKINGSVVIKPGEKATVGSNQKIIVGQALDEDAIDWKNGKFIFNDEPLHSILRKLGRWYNVDIIIEGADPEDTFYGSMSRYDNISQVLSKLEVAGSLHFKIEGRRIIVSK